MCIFVYFTVATTRAGLMTSAAGGNTRSPLCIYRVSYFFLYKIVFFSITARPLSGACRIKNVKPCHARKSCLVFYRQFRIMPRSYSFKPYDPKTSSSAVAERPRCSVGQLWPKYQYCFPYSMNIAVDCCCS